MRAGLSYAPDSAYTRPMQAHCQCGNLQADITGSGEGVMCHCRACQRRTGSPFGMMVYFAANAVTLSGSATEYTRQADSGNDVTHGFCPVCGTPLYLRTALHPDGIGIASGALAQEVAPPIRSVFEEGRHPWVSVPDGTQRHAHSRRG